MAVFIYCLFIVLAALKGSNCNHVSVGIITTFSNEYEHFIFKEVIELANREHRVSAVNVTLIEGLVENCSSSNTIGSIVEMIYKHNVSVIIDSCGSCQHALDTTLYFNKILISPKCSQVDTNSKNYNFLRTRPFARAHSLFIANTLETFARKEEWNLYGIAFAAGDGWTKAYLEIQKRLKQHKIQVESFPFEAYASIKDMLTDIQSRARIIYLMLPIKLTVEVLIESYNRGIHQSQKYQIITTDLNALEVEDIITDSALRSAVLTGVIDIGAKLSTDFNTTKYQNYLKFMKEKLFTKFPTDVVNNKPVHLDGVYEDGSYLYDAIMVYLQSVQGSITEKSRGQNQTVSSNTTMRNATTASNTTTIIPPVLDPSEAAYDIGIILDYVKRRSFHGLSGEIKFNELGTREPELKIRNFYPNETKTIFDGSQWLSTEILWLGGTFDKPTDTPPCGFDEKCPSNNDRIILIVALSIPLGLLFLFILFRIHKRQKYENDINNKCSILEFANIKTVSLYKTSLEDTIKEIGTLNLSNGVRRMKVIYNEKKVMLKKLPVKEALAPREVMIELKLLRDLEHKNINKFVGVTTRSPNICILQEWCKKGSLYDVLQNEEIQFDWVIKHALIRDIVNGMLAIHESDIKLHGHLTSKNCLINHRWVVQITDFGLTEFNKVRQIKDVDAAKNEQAKFDQLLWTAPENISFPYKTSRAGDVYSFGIIVSEVINGKKPYDAFQDMLSSDIVHYVKKRCIPPFRPHVAVQAGLDARLTDVMKECWHELPHERPSFQDVKQIIKIIGGEDTDVMDNIIEMMERYSRDLDKTAKERTEMYKKEKRKSNELLYRCVPGPIADELLDGKFIPPLSIESTTLMLIAIDNFMDLLDWLSPEQINDIVNDFYRMCDQVMKTHTNVYKLICEREELIYVSNLPFYAETSDADLMATLAIKVARKASSFRWRHLNDTPLNFKLTLHTGPAHGIVVGMKIPVYTLLGSTLDHIRLLTKYTPANKIVVTEASGKILRNNEEFLWEEIEEVQVDNKKIGMITPQYLIASATLGQAFPDEKDSALSQHSEQPRSHSEVHPDVVEKEESPFTQPKPKTAYWNVGSNVETAFQQWFANKRTEEITDGPKRIYTKNPLIKAP